MDLRPRITQNVSFSRICIQNRRDYSLAFHDFAASEHLEYLMYQLTADLHVENGGKYSLSTNNIPKSIYLSFKISPSL